MKRISFLSLMVLVCFAVPQYTYGTSPHEIIAGPENQGLRMNLHIENVDEKKADVYKVRISLINVGTTPIVLVAQWDYEEEKGDYCEFLKKQVEFTSFPEVRQDSAQTASRSGRTSPQPTLEIKPVDSVAVEWVTAPRRLKPQGYYNTTPTTFPSDGLYSVRARFLAISKHGKRILLYSNDHQLAVGGSTALPKFAMARIIQSDATEGNVLLNLGSDQKIEPNDRFGCSFFPFAYWDILITEVKPTVSTGSVKTRLREPGENIPLFPEAGSVAGLIPAVSRTSKALPKTLPLEQSRSMAADYRRKADICLYFENWDRIRIYGEPVTSSKLITVESKEITNFDETLASFRGSKKLAVVEVSHLFHTHYSGKDKEQELEKLKQKIKSYGFSEVVLLSETEVGLLILKE